jgi:hypothetical protein
LTKIDDLFIVKRGNGDYRANLSAGSTPLVSACNIDNGILDFVDIEPTSIAPAITVERVGGNAYVQLQDFATVPDDIAVLTPRTRMSLYKLYYVAPLINFQKWKYNYWIKLTPTRLKNMEIDLSNFKDNELDLSKRVPLHGEVSLIKHNTKSRLYNIEELFDLHRGDFHALDKLDSGKIPTVSRIFYNNGVTGYFEKPEDAEIYDKGMITISTVSGDAFVQLKDFMATDNVLICYPKMPFRITTLFFIAFMINKQKWRFSYGRQPYKRVFSQLDIIMPVKINADKLPEIDEEYIEKLLRNCYGWNAIERELCMGGKTSGFRKATEQSLITNFN